jgi:hypothetical protein
MEIDYKNFSVRIVHNPSDVIIRFTDIDTMRLWQTILTERDFVDYQILGGLEFAISVLKDALKSEVYEISEFKTTPKQLSFTVEYAPDEHCKQLNIEFLLPAIKKETANADIELVSKKIALLERGLAELAPLKKELSEQRQQVSLLKQDLESQKEKSAGYINISGCPFSISEDVLTLGLGLLNTSDPLNSQQYSAQYNYLSDMLPQLKYYVHSFKTITPLKYLKKCETLRIVNPTNLKDFSPIGEMTSLKHLQIVLSNPSSDLTDLEWIKNLSNLETAVLFNCRGVTNITPFTQLKKLTSLDIRGSGIQNTSALRSNITITR